MSRQVVTVFGGSGFVGRHLVHKLAATGAEIRVAVRDVEAAMFLKPAGNVGQIVLWQTDVTKPDQVATAVAGADVVINLIGILYERGQRSFQRMHVDVAASIAKAATDAGAKRLLHMSALGADPASPAAYARTKAAGEAAVKAAYPDATIFRPSVIFGPEDNFFNMFAGMMRFTPAMPVIGAPLLPSLSWGEGGLSVDFFGDGGCKFQPVFVGDVAQAMVAAIEDPASKGACYELGGPRVYSFKQVMELILAATERKRILVPAPLGVAELKAMFLQLLPKPLLTPDQVKLLGVDNVVSGSQPGFDALGISPTAAEAVLPTYLNRFRTPAHQGAHAV